MESKYILALASDGSYYGVYQMTCIVMLSIIGCSNALCERCVELVEEMSNDDIIWMPSFYGTSLKLKGPSLAIVRHSQVDAQVVSALIQRLRDPDAFAAAHAVLIYVHIDQPQLFFDHEWYGLSVDFFANGNVSYSRGAMKRVSAFWECFASHQVESTFHAWRRVRLRHRGLVCGTQVLGRTRMPLLRTQRCHLSLRYRSKIRGNKSTVMGEFAFLMMRAR